MLIRNILVCTVHVTMKPSEALPDFTLNKYTLKEIRTK